MQGVGIGFGIAAGAGRPAHMVPMAQDTATAMVHAITHLDTRTAVATTAADSGAKPLPILLKQRGPESPPGPLILLPVNDAPFIARSNRSKEPSMKNSAMIRLSNTRIMRNARNAGPGLLTGALVGTAALVATAALNRYLAKRAERENPPMGRFVNVDGLDVHYLERGQGPTLVLLHGNGSMVQDFASSGLMEAAAATHRVIAFDRPGFGHTDRPSRLRWGPNEQADLLQKVLDRLGVSEATVLGHSWGASVAAAMGIRYPTLVTKLVLISGYYFPTIRADFLAMSAPAIPIIGDLLSQTLSPIISRLMWPALLSKIFGPADVPAKFRSFPEEMAVRPSQIRASAEESALLIPSAAALRSQYTELGMPVTIIAGKDDKLIDPVSQSERLHAAIAHSELTVIPDHGHMVHQTATGAVMRALSDQATAASSER